MVKTPHEFTVPQSPSIQTHQGWSNKDNAFFIFSDIQDANSQHSPRTSFYGKMKQPFPASSLRKQVLRPKQNTEPPFPFPSFGSLIWNSVARTGPRQNHIICTYYT